MQTAQPILAALQPAFEPESILDSQRASWNRFSRGWERWDDFTMAFLDDQRGAITRALDVADDARVLDVASGTGEPGLSLARQASRGQVTAIDASSEMLRIARAKAARLGIDNFRTEEGDACALAFDDSSFDAVSCRLGFMFFPDMLDAAREMARVLRPGGRVATTVWAGSTNNPWVTTLVGAMRQHIDLPMPPAHAPGLFRCADPVIIPTVLSVAGLTVERIELNPASMRCESARAYWDFMTDVVPPVVAALGSADPATVDAVEREVLGRLGKGPVALESASYCIVARR